VKYFYQVITIRKIILYVFSSLLLLGPAWAAGDKDSLRHPLDAHLSKTDTADLPDMMEKRYVRVLTTMNRTNFFLAGANPYGFEYSMLCLLYTSPSPRDRTRSRMPSSA